MCQLLADAVGQVVVDAVSRWTGQLSANLVQLQHGAWLLDRDREADRQTDRQLCN